MWYKVKGTDEESGEPRDVIVEADSAGEAMEQARHDGVRPKSVAVTEEPAQSEDEDKSPRGTPFPALARLAAGFRFLAVINGVGAILGVAGGLFMISERNTGSGAVAVVAGIVGLAWAWLFSTAAGATEEVRQHMAKRR